MLGDLASPLIQENGNSKVLQYVQEWKSRLIDLSRKNKLLFFKHTEKGNLRIVSPDPETIFNKLVHKKRSMEFWMPPKEGNVSQTAQGVTTTPLDIIGQSAKPASNQLVCDSNLTREELERVLKKLNRRSLLDYRERGVRILYAAFGMLSWHDSVTNEDVQSPLVMVPVELSRKSVWEPFTLTVPLVEEAVIPNPALDVKLRTDFKIVLPPFPENGNGNLIDYFGSVTDLIAKFGWKVEPTLEIGLFSFHKLVIYKDLEANANVIIQHPTVRAIAGIKDTKLVLDGLPEEKDVDKIERPEKTFRVLDADSSQRISIDYALQGQSFVMQGPPGTGKSQTIANIISECIAHGKSVLFVSDKMAALEVVYKRLDNVGLAPFCLELHSSKANKQEVVAELMRCLNEQLVPRKLPLPHEFEKLSSLQSTLNGYVASLHAKHPILEMTPYEVLCELASLEAFPSVPVGLRNVGDLTPQRMRELEKLMSQLISVWQVVEEREFPWIGYRANTYSLEIRSELSTFLEKVISQLNLLKLESFEFAKKLGLDAPQSFAQINWLNEISHLTKESPKPEVNWLTHPNIYELDNEAKTYQNMLKWRQAIRNHLTESYDVSLFNLSLNKSSEIEQTLKGLRTLIKPTSVEEGELLKKQEKLADFVTKISELTTKWIDYATELCAQYGIESEDLTVDRVEQLSRLALLCFSDNKPEESWFDQAYFNQIQEIVPKAKKDFLEYNTLHDQVARNYDDRIYNLNLDELLRRYNGPYRGITRWFQQGFYQDQKQIALVTHQGYVPSTILKDLMDARRVRALKVEINSYNDRLKSLLGHFYNGFKTDFSKVENAIKATLDVYRILENPTVPEKLVKLISYRANVPQQIRWFGTELKESVEKWHQQVEELNSIIPVTFLPNSKLPIKRTPLQELQEWAHETRDQLNQLLSSTRDVLKTCKQGPENYRQLLDDLRNAEDMRKKETEFLERQSLLQGRFGSRFKGFDTNWEDILSVLDWTKKAQIIFGSNNMPEALAQIIASGTENAPPNERLIGYFNEAVKALSSLESRFENEITYDGQRLHNANVEAAINKVVALHARVDDLRVWVDFKEIKDRYSLIGLAPFFNRLVEKPFSAPHLLPIFQKGVYQEWINNLYVEDDYLGKFRRENHEQIISDFCQIDQELIHISANRVIAEANNRKPQDILIQAEDSEIGVLLRESAKKRRLMPIRSLLQRIPNLLTRLKPCLLMSPISVSQFLSPDLMKFDLILYDEASQIVPEDAVGSIYRGKTIVVAGDNKQLPPTSFFQKSLIEDLDWDETTEGEVEVFDSILDECLGIGLPVKTLRWHYRSRHESLIAFSNNQFYDGSLITFPSARAEDESLGVKSVHIKDAIYDRGGKRDNPKEAEAVADLVFEHFKNYPEKTLGVVTFSIAQMETIEEIIDRRLREEPEFEHFFKEDRLEGFFVKNLENVQGDERDVIIFSVGYGRDQKGQMTLNFGPLNKAGGERRLNVAVTRAREKVVVVTSILAADIEIGSSSAAGVQALRGYLEYAEKSGKASKSTIQPTKCDSALEEALAAEIRQIDYDVIPKVGYSAYPIDIGVIDPANPGCYLLGIECDGPTYYASNSARDRDRLREQVLRQLGWKIHRVWSPDWVARRESEVRRLKDALDQACKSKTTSCAPQPAKLDEEEDYVPRRREVEVRQVQFGGSERIGIPYKLHALKAYFNPYVKIPLSKYPYVQVQKNEFCFKENRVLQSRLLEELVREEGPVHFLYAVQRLASAWEVRRVGQKIFHAAKEALDMLIKDHRLTVKGEFLWPNDLLDVPVRVPVASMPESFRPAEQIPPEEIEKAIRLIVQYALSISIESLVAEAARLFGFIHPSEKTKQIILDIYNTMIRERKLIKTNDKINLP